MILHLAQIWSQQTFASKRFKQETDFSLSLGCKWYQNKVVWIEKLAENFYSWKKMVQKWLKCKTLNLLIKELDVDMIRIIFMTLFVNWIKFCPKYIDLYASIFCNHKKAIVCQKYPKFLQVFKILLDLFFLLKLTNMWC